MVLQKALRKRAHGNLDTEPDFQGFKMMGPLLVRKTLLMDENTKILSVMLMAQ
jgi:hypothetical protein